MRQLIVLLFVVCGAATANAAEPPSVVVSFLAGDGSLRVSIGGQEIAEYVWRDPQILRPYFRHLRTLGGIQVTRNSPPRTGDSADHDTMHPGLWLAFGDLSGADFWRNKAAVTHGGFLQEPQAGVGRGSFAVRNKYEHNARTICTEDCSVTISVCPGGYLLDWDSKFHASGGDFAFGDQEEMGLGVRVATPLAVVNGGEIADSQGRKNGKQVWGQQADWCRYGGVQNGRQIGVVLMPATSNFRTSWFHARDYGLVVANPFGRRAFTKGEPSHIVVAKGDTLRLRFAVFVYDLSADSAADLPQHVRSIYQQFIQPKLPSP